jgi:hypothetical protein
LTLAKEASEVPIIALTVPITMPAGAMRANLKAALPLWNWMCGDDDMGGPEDLALFHRPQTIMGRNFDDMVIMSVEDRPVLLPPEAGAPPHKRYLHCSQPSTEDTDLAKRIAIVVCGSLVAQDPGSHWQLECNGRWYSADELGEGLRLLTSKATSHLPADEALLRQNPALSGAAPPVAPLQDPDEPRPAASVPEPLSGRAQPLPNFLPSASGRAAGFGRRGL